MNRLLPLSCLGALLAAGSCAHPRLDYDVQQIAACTDLEELMYVQETVAEPVFELARRLTPDTVDDAAQARFLDMAVRLQVSAEVLETLSGLEDFQAFARDMGARAAAVEQAADMQDMPALLEGTLAVEAACLACHEVYE